MYRFYEDAEQWLGFFRGLADTWYFVFRKEPVVQRMTGGNP